MSRELALEVCSSINPLIDKLRKDLLPENPFFLGLELHPEWLIAIKNKKPSYLENYSGVIVQGDVLHAPIATGSASVILMKEVLGEFKNYRILRKEIVRICKTTGYVVVVESVMPEINKRQNVDKFFENIGFGLVEGYTGHKVNKVFNKLFLTFSKIDFALVFQKSN